jgi:hypothetical protein
MIPFLPLLLRYRRWIAYGLAALAVAWALWAAIDGYGDRRASAEKAAVMARWAAATEASNAENRARDAEYERTKGERDAAMTQVAAILNRPPVDPKTLIVRVPTDAPGITCPDRGSEFRLRFNEIATSAGYR